MQYRAGGMCYFTGDVLRRKTVVSRTGLTAGLPAGFERDYLGRDVWTALCL